MNLSKALFLIVFLSTGTSVLAFNGTIIDHRVIETTEVDGSKVPGKIEITAEECLALAASRGLSTGKVMKAEQPLNESEMAVQESLTGRQVVSRVVNFCLAQ